MCVFECVCVRETDSITPWPEISSELYRPSDLRLSANLVTDFADRRCRLTSVTDPHGHNQDFLDGAATFTSK
jgi:hypothetical protein